MVIYRNSTGLGVNPETVALLEKFEGKQAVLASEYSNKLNIINANNNGAISLVVNWFQDVNLLTDVQRLKFMEHFAERVDDLKQLNNSDTLRNWLELVSMEIKEAAKINVVTDNTITKGFLRYYIHPGLEEVLETFTYLQKIKFLKQYANADVALFNKILERPKSTLEFLSSAQNRIKVSQIDKYNAEDIIIIAKSELKPIPLELATIKNNSVLQDMMNRFLKEVNYELIDTNRLRSLYNGSAVEFQSMIQNLSPKQLKEFRSSNKAVITTEVHQNGSFVERFHEKYISGSETKIRDDIFGGNVPSDLIEPNRLTYDIFKKRAIDDLGGSRGDDTEMKYIANFIENHWDKGDQFIITIESTLYACNNCKSYLIYVKDVAKKYGKNIEYNFVTNKKAINGTELKDIIR